jgi:rRNA maturation endonuclease Nob1
MQRQDVIANNDTIQNFIENGIENFAQTCLYCRKDFQLYDSQFIDETTLLACPHCGGEHETKGFL